MLARYEDFLEQFCAAVFLGASIWLISMTKYTAGYVVAALWIVTAVGLYFSKTWALKLASVQLFLSSILLPFAFFNQFSYRDEVLSGGPVLSHAARVTIFCIVEIIFLGAVFFLEKLAKKRYER